MRADEARVEAVAEWPRPTPRRQLQRFLGFSNFYTRFIRNYSHLAAPLTALTSSKTPFSWSPEAETAFHSLKQRFTTAPVLRYPDPSLQFVVEVDALKTGVEAVLSQRSSKDKKLHPCAFFSNLLLDYCGLCQSPAALGLTLLWILLQVCPPPKVTQLSSLLLTGSPRLFILSPFPSCPHSRPHTETQRLLTYIHHVFRLHGIPLDIVSDRGRTLRPKSGRPSARP